jgi:hypothetical protein
MLNHHLLLLTVYHIKLNPNPNPNCLPHKALFIFGVVISKGSINSLINSDKTLSLFYRRLPIE